jgi:hypothetical protein
MSYVICHMSIFRLCSTTTGLGLSTLPTLPDDPYDVESSTDDADTGTGDRDDRDMERAQQRVLEGRKQEVNTEARKLRVDTHDTDACDAIHPYTLQAKHSSDIPDIDIHSSHESDIHERHERHESVTAVTASMQASAPHTPPRGAACAVVATSPTQHTRRASSFGSGRGDHIGYEAGTGVFDVDPSAPHMDVICIAERKSSSSLLQSLGAAGAVGASLGMGMSGKSRYAVIVPTESAESADRTTDV